LNRIKALLSWIATRCRRLLARLAANPRSLLATLFFAGLAVGFWMAWPPLGLIVPSALGFVCLAFSHLTGASPDA